MAAIEDIIKSDQVERLKAIAISGFGIDEELVKGLTEYEFNSRYPKEEYEIYSDAAINSFSKALNDEIGKNPENKDFVLEKAKKDLSKLQKKTVIGKNGKRYTVWVKNATFNNEDEVLAHHGFKKLDKPDTLQNSYFDKKTGHYKNDNEEYDYEVAYDKESRTLTYFGGYDYNKGGDVTKVKINDHNDLHNKLKSIHEYYKKNSNNSKDGNEHSFKPGDRVKDQYGVQHEVREVNDNVILTSKGERLHVTKVSKVNEDNSVIKKLKELFNSQLDKIKDSTNGNYQYREFSKFRDYFVDAAEDMNLENLKFAGHMGNIQLSWEGGKDGHFKLNLVDDYRKKIDAIEKELNVLGLKVKEKIDHGSYKVSGGIYDGKRANMISLILKTK